MENYSHTMGNVGVNHLIPAVSNKQGDIGANSKYQFLKEDLVNIYTPSLKQSIVNSV